MPTLNWASKITPEPIPAALVLDSIIYPHGIGYSSSYDINTSDRQPVTPLPDNRGANQSLLIQGDNLAVMSALLPEFTGRIQMIYTDPPFFTNRHYSARVGRGEDSRRPQEWLLEEGYPDHWPNLDAYLDMLYPRLALMHRLLSQTGTLYLHLDWHANAYARLLLDEIFGADRLLNEIIWTYHGPSPIRSAFNRKHDTILVYTKSENYTFNVDAVRQPYDPQTIKTFASSSKAGFGKVPNLQRGKVPEDWWYFPVVARMHSERTGYPTQKPEALLERILLASSNPGDLVADFFCGSGTTAVSAAQLGRHFIAVDSTRRAVNTSRSRLVSLAREPFKLYTLSPNMYKTNEDKARDLFHLEGKTITIAETLVPNLDYWEVDPAWDGQVFQSATQAVRPRKNQAIASSLELPEVSVGRVIEDGEQMTGHGAGLPPMITSHQSPVTSPLSQHPPIAVRLLNINGEQSQWVLDRSKISRKSNNTRQIVLLEKLL